MRRVLPEGAEQRFVFFVRSLLARVPNKADHTCSLCSLSAVGPVLLRHLVFGPASPSGVPIPLGHRDGWEFQGCSRTPEYFCALWRARPGVPVPCATTIFVQVLGPTG